MSTMRKILPVFLVLWTARAAVCDELTPAKEKDIRLLMDVTGAAATGQQMSQAMVGQMAELAGALEPARREEVARILREEANALIAERMPALVDRIVPVYADHFSHREIKRLVKFYRSDLGRKMTSTLPALLQGSMRAGQEWGQSLAPALLERVGARLKAEGIDLRKPDAPAKGAAPRDPGAGRRRGPRPSR